MADLSVGTMDGATGQRGFPAGPYWISPLVGVSVVVEVTTRDVNAFRTTDGGANWTQIELDTDNDTRFLCCFFDQEVPGDTGTLVHCWWMGTTSGDISYRTIDVNDGSLGTHQTVVNFTGSTTNRMWACKTRNGNLLVGGTYGANQFCYRSVDAGANWTSRATGQEDSADSAYLFPANTGDGADAALIYYDDSAAELSVKMYDDSADTWTETSILTSVDPGSGDINISALSMFDGAVRHSDGLILGCVFSNPNVTGNDLLTFTVNPNSIASPTISTSTANVLTDETEAAYCAIAINQQNDDVYVAYATGAAYGSSLGVDFVKSDDGMATWGSPVAYMENADADIRRVTGPRSVGDDGGRIQWTHSDDDLHEYFVNLNNDIEIAAAGGGETPTFIKLVGNGGGLVGGGGLIGGRSGLVG